MASPKSAIAYERFNGSERFLIVLNLGHEEQIVPLADRHGQLVLSTHLDRDGEAIGGSLRLRADEGIIAELQR
jgi:alpha-glucosidase